MNINKIELNNDINIKPLSKIKKKPRQISEPLPDPHSDREFLMIISSKTGSGKSVLIANILRNLYYRYFDRVYFCSSNINDNEIYDVAYKNITIPPERLFDDFNDSIMEYIVEDIRDDPDFETSQYLLVVDDLPTELQKRSSKIVKNILKHRHIHLNIIVVTQKLNLLNLSLRNNCTHLISYKTMNRDERESMATMTELNKEDFFKLLDTATNERYNFLFVDLLQNPTKFYKNFNTELKLS